MFFRKSFGLARGLRLNVSSSGLGVSGGIKGLSLSVGPRGVYAYGSAGPIRMQTRIGGGGTHAVSESPASDRGVHLANPFVFRRPQNVRFHAVVWPTLVLCIFVSSAVALPAVFSLPVVAAIVCWFVPSGRVRSWRDYQKRRDQLVQLDPSERLKQLATFVAENPQSAHLRFELAQALDQVGRFGDAAGIWLQLGSDTQVSELFARAGGSYYEARECADALKCFEFCDERKEYDGFFAVQILRARCFFELEQHDTALEVIAAAMRRRGEDLIPGKRFLRLLRAQIRHATGNVSRAKSELRKLTEEAPDFEPAHELLAELERAA